MIFQKKSKDTSKRIHELERENKELKKENGELKEKLEQLDSSLSSMRIQHDAVMAEYLKSLEETKEIAQKARECIRETMNTKKEYNRKLESALDQISKAGKRINKDNNDDE